MRKKQQKAFSHGSYAKRVLKSRGYMGTDRTQMVFERGVKVVADSDMVIQDADKMMNSPLLSGGSSWVIVRCPFAVVLLCTHPVADGCIL
jgi:hypothetical protein